MCAERKLETDVLIVGSGAVGVAAGIEAREAGASVILLEKEEILGGAAAVSGGGCAIVDTFLQRETGIEDSHDLAFQDWIKAGQGKADEVWARFYIERSNDALFEWAKDRGVEWVGARQNEGNSVPRWHQPKGGGGGLWNALYQTAQDRGIDTWLTNTAAKELIVEDGRIIGVIAEDTTSGDTVEVLAKAVVMGSGGFNSNIDMVKEVRPDLRRHRILEGSGRGDTGDGHGMVEAVGGTTTHMDDIWFYVFAIPDHKDERGRRGLVIRGVPDNIWVNAQGVRFHNEDLSGGGTGSVAVLAQEPAYCWSVMDSTMTDDVTVSDPQYYIPGASVKDPEKVKALIEESPHIKSGDTLEALASEIGVPEDTFVETVNHYNSGIDQGLKEDPDFGRPLSNRKMIQSPPYYALNFTPTARKNFGGVKTDLKCRAVDKHYEPIPGLFVAGELAGMAGGHINGKHGLEGTMLGPALFSGRVAGAWAAKDAGFGEGFK